MLSRHACAGVASLEFALLGPVLMVLLIGTLDLSNALLTVRRMGIAAGSIAEIATTEAAQTRSLNILTDQQAWQATTAAFALFPEWAQKSASPSFAVTISAVTFTASPRGCTQNCAYTANVAWSVANDLGLRQLRACGSLTRAPDDDAASYTTLPASNFGPASLLIADISYTFQPFFFGLLIGNIPMMQSAYLSPRIDNGIQLSKTTGAGSSIICPVAN